MLGHLGVLNLSSESPCYEYLFTIPSIGEVDIKTDAKRILKHISNWSLVVVKSLFKLDVLPLEGISCVQARVDSWGLAYPKCTQVTGNHGETETLLVALIGT